MATTTKTEIQMAREEELKGLRLPELRKLYEAATGETSRSPNKTFFARKIAAAEMDAADAEGQGGETETPAATISDIQVEDEGDAATKTAPAARDPRLPEQGTPIPRTYKGTHYQMTETPDGTFSVADQDANSHLGTFKSVSAAAQALTGAKAINGWTWFGLGKKDTEKARERRQQTAAQRAEKKAETLTTRVQAFLDTGDAPAAFLDALESLVADARGRAAAQE